MCEVGKVEDKEKRKKEKKSGRQVMAFYRLGGKVLRMVSFKKTPSSEVAKVTVIRHVYNEISVHEVLFNERVYSSVTHPSLAFLTFLMYL